MPMLWRCDLTPQYKDYEKEILSAVQRVFESGVYVLGKEVAQFEKEFASYVGVPHCVGVANATDGLTLSLMALGVGSGDEVITTPYTAIPTISAIVDAGAKPVFVDIDPETFLIDQKAILKAVNSRTKAIMPVHIFGNVFDIASLRSKLPTHIHIIEDAAQAHGATYNRKQAGSFAPLSVFSFYPTKNLGGYGDGGAICVQDDAMAAKLRKMRMYGMINKDCFEIDGINSRLDEVQAAILSIKLKHLDKMNTRRNEIAARYYKDLPTDVFSFQKIPSNIVSNHHVFVVRCKDRRNELVEYLAKKEIQTNIYYVVPHHLQKAMTHLGYKIGSLPIAEKLCSEAIALPLYPEFPAEQYQTVINAIRGFYQP